MGAVVAKHDTKVQTVHAVPSKRVEKPDTKILHELGLVMATMLEGTKSVATAWIHKMLR